MSEEVLLYKVPQKCIGMRADKVLAAYLTEFSRVQIQEVFNKGKILVKGKPVEKSYTVCAGDEMQIELPAAKTIKIHPINLPVEVIYEDEDIIVVNKEAGVVVHPGAGTDEDTLVHRLLYYTHGQLSSMGGELRPGVVHRLDKETSGAIVFAKTNRAYLGLIKAFSNREIDKEYLALVVGAPDLDGGSIRDPIGRHPRNRVKMHVSEDGRPAKTDWRVEKRFKDSTLIRCWLYTGRTHQIRVHLSQCLKSPLLGDVTYGYRASVNEPLPPKRIYLHAQILGFKHPVTGKELVFEVPLPEDFKRQLEARGLMKI